MSNLISVKDTKEQRQSFESWCIQWNVASVFPLDNNGQYEDYTIHLMYCAWLQGQIGNYYITNCSNKCMEGKMENLKIKVNNKLENEEVKSLLVKQGYKLGHFYDNERFPRWVETSNEGEDFWFCTGAPLSRSLKGVKDITISELRNLVSK